MKKDLIRKRWRTLSIIFYVSPGEGKIPIIMVHMTQNMSQIKGERVNNKYDLFIHDYYSNIYICYDEI